jgi:amino acid adenylation domain-containing protein/FkbM family methyltransferase
VKDRSELLTLLLEQEGLAEVAQTIGPRPDAGERPLSFAQQRLWFLDQMAPGSSMYNMPAGLCLSGPLEVAALARSLDAIVARHESLRATFPAAEGRPRQVVAPPAPQPLERVDLSHLSQERAEEAVHDRLRAESDHSFDLTVGPLLRTALLALRPDHHVLVVNMHHIVSDGWSMGVFLRELLGLYEAFRNGRPSPLPELPVQYADFAHWQRQWLAGEVLESQLDYWRARLADAPAVLRLPTDRPRPPVQSHRGAVHTFDLPKHLVAEVRELSQREGVTPFMTLLAAYQTLLHRYTGDERLVVASSIANRNRVEVEGLIGFFVNMLPLHTDLSGDPTCRELLRRVRDVTLGAYEHQDLPFDRLVEELAPERDLSVAPLCQVFFALQNTPMPSLELPGLRLSLLEAERRTAKYDLYLTFSEREGAWHGELEYATDLFEAATIRRIARHYVQLLEGFVAHPAERLSALPMLGAQERERILRDWSRTPPEAAAGSPPLAEPGPSLAELFDAQAARRPDAVAVICGDDRLTYGELARRANGLAHRLRSLGAGPEVPVAVALERSLDTLAGLLGVLKAGAVYVPLDPACPQASLAFVLEDTGAPLLVTRAGLVPRLGASTPRLVLLDADTGAGADDPPNPAARPDQLAMIAYTSGSTGRPKGVAVPHRQFLNRFAWMWRRYPFGADEVTCQRTVITFSISIWELLGGLLQGVPTVILPDDVVRDAEALVGALSRHGVTRIGLVPSLLRMLLDGPSDLARELPRLRLWSVAGEPLSPELCRQFQERLPGARLLNQYGATELNDTAWYEVPVDVPGGARLPIGRPIPGVSVYVLDPRLQPVPAGVPGDLYVGGEGHARGYWKRPDLTAERFRPHPFATTPGARLYATGDRARFHADGTLEHLGRQDQQVKVRGVRVELPGIEAVLRQHPDVSQAAVLAPEAPDGSRSLEACVVPRPARAAVVAGHPRYRLPNNLAVVHLNRNETDFLYRELYEGHTYFKHGISLEEGDCVFDVGANIGLFALLAHLRTRGAVEVHAFEPNPTAFEALRLNASLYGVRARLHRCGLGATEATARFTFYPGFTFMSGLYADPEEEKAVVRSFIRTQAGAALAGGPGLGPEREEALEELLDERFAAQEMDVRLRRLSDVLREEGIAQVDLLKVNVEKAELDVIRGIDTADWRKIRQVVLQVHDRDGRLEEIVGLLRGRGFEPTVVKDWAVEASQHVYYVYATRPQDSRRREAAAPPAPEPLPEPFLTPGDLRAFLLERLPEPMVPTAFTLLESLPLTPNGKVDRRALSRLAAESRRSAPADVAPRDEVEAQLARIVAEVLGLPRVGVTKSFFELGGHSLLATQVVSRVRRAFGLELPVGALFESPTVAGLARVVRAARGGEADDEALQILQMVEGMSDAEAMNEMTRAQSR